MATRRRRAMRASQKLIVFLLVIAATVGIVWYLVRGGGKQVTTASAGVIISEVMTSNKGVVTDETGDHPDWIELRNTTDKAVDIGGYGLSDDIASAAKWTFPGGASIPANGYILVFCSGDATRGRMHAPFKLSASDSVILSSVSGSIIDSVQLTTVESGLTLSRDEAGGTWQAKRPSPGYPNTDEGAAAYLASLAAGANESIGVFINEFMASNASTLVGPDGSYCDWIELYNTNGNAVDVSGYGVSDDVSEPHKYTLPQGTQIEGYGTLLIYCTGRETQPDTGRIEAPFGLAAYQESVVFSTPAGKILDSFNYDRLGTDISMARIPDGTGAFQASAQPTPGYTNNNAGLRAFQATLSFGTGDLILSEAMNANYSFLKQPDQQYYDWIELHNTSATAINLFGYALSNNAKNPAKWVFPNVSIDPGGYFVVLASGKNVADAQKKTLETNFSLSGSGEVVLLFSPEGKLLDKLLLGAAHADVSYGRTGRDLLYYDAPTPGAANTGGLPGYAEKPVIGLAAGTYRGAQQITITAPQNSTVTYTTDGSIPTQSSAAYTGPIPITKTTVVRARAFTSGVYGSDTATASYIIDTSAVTTGEHPHTLPVVSIATDEANLYDPDIGIYVLGSRYAAAEQDSDPFAVTMEGGMNAPSATLANFWQDWERPVHFDIIDETGAYEYDSDAMIRIFGAFSRAKEQKGFTLIARAGYGPSTFSHKLFDNRPYTEYKSFILRSSAQDATNSRIRDIVITSLFDDYYGDVIPVQAYRQAVVYINGKYFGVYNIREKISKFFIAQHYGLANPDAIDILNGNGNDRCVINEASGTSWTDYTKMVEWAGSHDLSNPENYKTICQQMDVENYALYCAMEIVVGNTDTGNIKYWRSEETDNKWRWLIYDFCWAMNRDDPNTSAEYSSGFRRDFIARYFHEKGHGASKSTSTVLSRALLQNASFRQLFLDACAKMINEVYTEENIIARVDECQAAIQTEMQYDVELWDGITYTSWQAHCDNIRKYAKNYRPYFLKYVQAYFSLSDNEMMTIFGETSSLNG